MKKYIIAISAIAIGLQVNAQQVKVLTAKDYQHAESFLSANTESFIDRGTVRPNWLSGDKFWYTISNSKGVEFWIVDPVKKTKLPLFDHQKLAEALSTASGTKIDANKLPFQSINLSADNKSFTFSSSKKSWKYIISTNEISDDISSVVVESSSRFGRGGNGEISSPDGKKVVWIKDWNLWVRDVATKTETQLTRDGVKDFGYATDNAGWTMSNRAIVLWSPDSKKIATYQQDQRKVSDMYLVSTNVGKPILKAWKYPLPDDKDVTMIERVVIDVENAKVVRLQLPPDQRRSTFSDDIVDKGNFADVNWSADGTHLVFVSTSRDHKEEKIRMADASSGAVKEIFEEKSATQFESGWDAINWRYLSATNEILWFSERDNWGHIYLYDATNGKLKNQITKGDWVLTNLLKVDEKNRMLYFMAGGKEPGNPYFEHFYKIGFDGKNLTSLTPDLGNHSIAISPSGNYFIDTYSQPNVAEVVAVRDMKGNLAANLGKTDVSRLIANGWKPPIPVEVKAHDGKTSIYGLVFTPTTMDASKKYPVIDYIYPGPQGGSVGSWSFTASRSDHQALEELGFIVVVIEGTGNPNRSKSFHDMSYGNMGDNTLPDQMAAIRQLAGKYPIDTNKVGIWGHSGGGFATATAMFKYPDFFKVGISESGNHENRNYEDNWGERYNGLVENSDYAGQANQNFAKNLKGKLMLAHGMMDNNVPPSNTMLVVEALIKANKTFDLVIFPNSAHGFGPYSPYMMRRRWDYFVTNLLGAEAPKDFSMKLPEQRN